MSEHHSVLTEEQLAPPLPGAAQLALTRWLIFVEQNLRWCWRFYCTLALFLSAAWLDLFSFFPGFLHLLALAAFTVAFLHTLWGTGPGWRWPSVNAAARRLETANALHHHPYEALLAKPVGAVDSAVKTLWRQHQDRARHRLQSLRLPWPHWRIEGTDRYYLRLASAGALLIALVFGHAELGLRLQRAVALGVEAPSLGPVAHVTAWVTPPTYTGQAPIMLAESGKAAKSGTVRIPAGSKLALRVTEQSAVPTLVSDTGSQPLKAAGEQVFTLDTVVPETTTLKITSGWWTTLARWSVTLVPDSAPQISWRAPPAIDAQQQAQLHYHVADDYGVKQVELVMNLAVSARGVPTVAQHFPLSGAGQKQYDGKTALPLGASLWAGLPVTLVATATDQAGQTGSTPSVTLTLPEHVFRDPLAKELAALRQNLLLDPDANWKLTLNTLVAIARDVPRYRGDKRILLGLRSTAVRMYLDQLHTQLTPVATILWQMALALDNGGLDEAAEKLRSAQQQLEQALANHADSATVQEKMQQLQQAMAEYMQNMARNQPSDAKDIPQDLLDDAGKQMAQDMLQRMQEIQDLAQTGNHEAAAQKLRELQQMLDDLRQAKPMTEEQKAELQNLKDMRDMIQQQQKLQEQTGKAAQQQAQPQPQQGQQAPEQPPQPTYASPRPPEEYPEAQPGQQQAQQPPPQTGPEQGAGHDQTGQPSGGAQGQPGAHGSPQQQAQQQGQPGAGGQQPAPQPQPGGQTGKDLAQQQGSLRDKLGKMIEDMAGRQQQPPQQFGTADQGMKSAGEKLQQENMRGAQQDQGKTLQALKELEGKMKQNIQQQLMVLPSGQGGQAGAPQQNPFGNSDKEGRGAVDQQVKVPDQQEVQRARKILDELRRRSGEYERPKDERSYIERLLNKF